MLVARVAESERRLTPLELCREVSGKTALPPGVVRGVLRRLVEAGRLAYRYDDGHSFVGACRSGAVPLTGRVLLLEPRTSAPVGPNKVAIRILPGAAFGSGEHPTTGLAMRGIEHVLFDSRGHRPMRRILDIGTGSGILAIAALRLGMASAVGVDRDACARHEAVENARRNGVADRFMVFGRPVPDIRGSFDLAAANLRFPTLCRLKALLEARVRPGGAVVVSGLRIEETPDLLEAYNRDGALHCVWQREDRNWVGLAFRVQGPGVYEPLPEKEPRSPKTPQPLEKDN
jgi:ribosomal protein L11 methyltransferase